jgi:hypothetical protein
VDSVQQTAVLGTSRIILKVLQSETWSLSCGDPPLVQEEKYQWAKACGKRNDDDDNDNNNNNNTVEPLITDTLINEHLQ